MSFMELWQSGVASVPPEAGLMLLVALVVSSLGYLRVVWFISLGYAGSVSVTAVLLAWLFRDTLTPWSGAHALLLLVYGLRLGSYLVRRELKPGYAQTYADDKKRGDDVKTVLKPVIWVTVSLLYVLMTSPLLLVLTDGRGSSDAEPGLLQVVGLLIAAGGLSLEAYADHQKSRYKETHAGHWCDVGLYRFVRCPNYLGEMTFWVGSWIAGVAAYHHGLHWVGTGVGLVCIVLIMLGSTRRLEAGQEERYGDREGFHAYTQSVPVILPFIPLYTLKNLRIYLG